MAEKRHALTDAVTAILATNSLPVIRFIGDGNQEWSGEGYFCEPVYQHSGTKRTAVEGRARLWRVYRLPGFDHSLMGWRTACPEASVLDLLRAAGFVVTAIGQQGGTGVAEVQTPQT